MRRFATATLMLAASAATTSRAAEGPARLEQFAIPGVEPKAADGDAPLAKGWPGGTAPGVIEVKAYPAYRGAVARGTGVTAGGDDVLFFPLFRHITRSDIAMTAPVVNNYSAEMGRDPKARGDVSMEFVYRSPDQGTAGPGVGAVRVEDRPAASFACLGVQGDVDAGRFAQAVEALRRWLVEHKSEWVEDGPPRRLGYHGPMTERDRRLFEVQIPVKPAPPDPAGGKP